MKKSTPLIIALAWIVIAACSKDSASGVFKPTTGTGGSMARFTIAGNYLYTVDKTHLKVYSLSDPGNPVLKSDTEAGFEIETIFPFKDKLFLGSTSVVYIFSLENPERPEKLSTAESKQVFQRCDPVVAKETAAYATLRTNGPCGGMQSVLAVYDITNINAPVERTTYPLYEPYGLGYADSALYVCDKTTLQVFNISQPFNPVVVNSLYDANYIDVIPYDDTLICWVSDGIILYDISERFNPKLIIKIT